MTFCADDTHPKARKDHICCACCEKIPAGVTYAKTFYVDGGTASADKWHLECREEFIRGLQENGETDGDPYSTWENGLPDQLRAKYNLPARMP